MIAFLASQVVAFLAGALLMVALGAWRMPFGLFVPAAWLGGTGLLAVEQLLLAQVGVPWNPLSLGLPWLAVVILAVRRVHIACNGRWADCLRTIRPNQGRTIGSERAKNRRWTMDHQITNVYRLSSIVHRLSMETLVAIVLIAWTTMMLIKATSTPPTGWDAQVDWLFKGRAMYLAGGIPLDFYTNHYFAQYVHLDYPPLVPLAVAQIYAWTGDNDTLVKGWWALLGGAAIAGVYYGLCGLAGRLARLGGLVLLLAMPEMVANSAGYFAGYADLPMAVLFLYGA
jgi:hypothetical protein